MRFCISQILLLILLLSACKGREVQTQLQNPRKKATQRQMQHRKRLRMLRSREALRHLRVLAAGSGRTKAVLTLNSFEEGGDGRGKSECDDMFHSDKTKVVALSNGWLGHGLKRFNKTITIKGNRRRMTAKVVDECDSTIGCDDYHPPRQNNIVDASPTVWEALGVPDNERGWMEVLWFDGH
ncbi:hypothetical protein OROMI_004760 [Orobanche minor]